MAKTRLSLENINKTINDKKILLDINFNIESAEIVRGGKVRRNHLTYLRGLSGRAARIKERRIK